MRSPPPGIRNQCVFDCTPHGPVVTRRVSLAGGALRRELGRAAADGGCVWETGRAAHQGAPEVTHEALPGKDPVHPGRGRENGGRRLQPH